MGESGRDGERNEGEGRIGERGGRQKGERVKHSSAKITG